MDLLGSFLHKSFQALASVGRGGLTSETQSNGCQDCAFATAVMAYDEIDEWSKFNFQPCMTHEIGAQD